MADVEILPKRIVDKITYPSNGCWLFSGSLTHNGYGQIKLNRKTTRVHRYSYELFNGNIDNNLLVLHKCDTRNCMGPDHLFLGTSKDNTKDMINKGRFSCGFNTGNWTHPDGRESILSKEDVLNIKSDFFDKKITQDKIANKYKVTQSHISRIINNKVCI